METSRTDVLDRVLDPVSRSFNLESARALVQARPDDEVEQRVSELANKCNEGRLSPTEHEEYETYIRAGDIIASATQGLLLLRSPRRRPSPIFSPDKITRGGRSCANPAITSG